MTDMLRYKWTSFGPMLDEDGPFVTYADHLEALLQAEHWATPEHVEQANFWYEQGQRDALNAAVQRVEAIADDPNSGVDWNWDYDIDPTGMTRNPLVWIREAVAAIRNEAKW